MLCWRAAMAGAASGVELEKVSSSTRRVRGVERTGGFETRRRADGTGRGGAAEDMPGRGAGSRRVPGPERCGRALDWIMSSTGRRR